MKIIKIACAMLLTIAALSFVPNIASAEHVWFYSVNSNGNQWEYYLDTDSIESDKYHGRWSCRVPLVRNGQGHSNRTYVVAAVEKTYRIYMRTGTGLEDCGYVSDSEFATRLWNTLKKYVDIY